MDKTERILTLLLGQIAGYHNGESVEHIRQISRLTEILLDQLTEKTDTYRITETERKEIVLASALHDIGKIGIDKELLNKPEKLTDAEFETVKQHTVIGSSIIENIKKHEESSLLERAYQICRWHHERYDGSGYPDGLSGEEIPISAQVVALADVYDALVSERCYKSAYSHEQAIGMILDGKCGSFHPILLELLGDTDVTRKMKASVKQNSM